MSKRGRTKTVKMFGAALIAFFLLWGAHGEVGAASFRPLRVAATTTTKVSGILDVLHSAFEKRFGIPIHAVAVGTGQAIRIARSGDADVLFVHSPEAEKNFIRDGYGLRRRRVMYNYFLIAGPESDPAHIEGLKDGAVALGRIARSRSRFFSRGDESGTHRKEQSLWKVIGKVPSGDWYQQTGQGMGETLRIADEKRGYVLCDRGSFIKLSTKKRINLRVLVTDDKRFLNTYSVILVNPKMHPHVFFRAAKSYADFLVSSEGQRIIDNYRVGGLRLFTPGARLSRQD